LNIIMAGVDYRSASLELREKVGFNKNQIRDILAKINKEACVSGVVLISTCNRTEAYISLSHCEEADPVEIFCNAANLDDDMKKCFYVKKGEDLAVYLFELACGIHSMIFGEDQILTQVKEAMLIAIDEGASDAVLNTLFRCAITCAKKVKTQLVLNAVSPSVAGQSVQLVSEYIEKKAGCKALVIGNGAVGRKVCEELIAKGCEVHITTRTHNNKSIIVPTGCKVIPYHDRESLIPYVDILISATSSPHQTVTIDMIDRCANKPKYIIDLAVPRDIDPEVGKINGILYYNIDSLGETARKDNSKEISAMKSLIAEHIENFNKWYAQRKRLMAVK
jgi:glutamyl-tRNA reductase